MKNSISILICSLFVLCSSFTTDNENSNDHQKNRSEIDDDEKLYFYYYKGKKIYLELNTKNIFISSHQRNAIQQSDLSSRSKISRVSGVKEDNTSQLLDKPKNFTAKTPLRYWSEIELNGISKSKDYFDLIENLRGSTSLLVSQYFKGKSGDKIGLSNYFYVKLKDNDDFEVLMEVAEKYHVDLIGFNKYMPLWFTLSTTQKSDDAMQLANLFYETGLFEQAQPDLISDIKLNNGKSSSNSSLLSADPFYSDQWGLINIGQNNGTAGIDIKVEPAWQISTGDHNITVAVIDEGIQLNHPDLASNIVGSYDTATGTSPSQVYGAHGTACAGIIGAVGNNGIGITGVAPNIGLLSVSKSFGNRPNHHQEFADGINWSWRNGADVINNSWSMSVPSGILDDAINQALSNGRDGLGTVVVFATGNDYSAVSYPANSNSDILAVGSIDGLGKKANTSNFGPELDIVAPGVSISTTDRTGDVPDSTDPCSNRQYTDYNPDFCILDNYANYDYTNSFTGTSAAAPHVAAVAALMLTVNPNLTAREVNDKIEKTAQKIRPDIYPYQNNPDRPNGNWDNQVGYGLVDAYKALLSAQSGSNSSCDEDVTISNVSSGGIYKANNTINSTANISPNLGFVEFNAGSSITMMPGFLADGYNGYYFHSEIKDCVPEANRRALHKEWYEYIIDNVEINSLDNDNVSYTLENYPNPFSDETIFELSLNKSEVISLYVTDVNGKLVSKIQEAGLLGEGKYQFSFYAKDYQSGIYYYTMQIGNDLKSGKLFLLK